MPRRPPKAWFDRVVKKLQGKVSEPESVASWLWFHSMAPEHRRRVLRSENPRVSSRLIEQAVEQYEKFHGRLPTKGDYMTIPDPPRVAVIVGELIQVNYRAKKRGDKKMMEYYHRFESPRPVLLTDPKGNRLFISGGRYKIREEGIEG